MKQLIYVFIFSIGIFSQSLTEKGAQTDNHIDYEVYKVSSEIFIDF